MKNFLLKGYTKAVLIIVFLIIAALIGYFISTNRFTDLSFFIKSGSLKIEAPEAGTNIFLDGLKKKTSSVKGEKISLSAKVGRHNIIVSKDGYWPWTKDVEIKSKEEIDLYPFFVPQNPSGSIITPADPEYEKILALIKENVPPTIQNKKISKDGSVAVWLHYGSLKAAWLLGIKTLPSYFCKDGVCKEELSVISPKGIIRNVDFYKNRDDVLIISIDNGIFAIELDSRRTQNFEPIYKGLNPTFSKGPADSIFVYDGGQLLEVSL